jgi:PEGA domain-containing protein
VTHRKLVVATAGLAAVCALSAANVEAQHRGRGHFRTRGFVGGYYDPFFYSPFFFTPFGWGPYAYAPYAYGAYAPYRFRGAPTGEARVLVTPKRAEVFVDGYRAGIVDDFDGAFQRLHVTPGGHEITLFLPGYRTLTERVYFGEGSTVKIRETMAPLAPGEKSEPPPAPEPRRRSRSRDEERQEQ